jgi:hypothetical protein
MISLKCRSSILITRLLDVHEINICTAKSCTAVEQVLADHGQHLVAIFHVLLGLETTKKS